ncbi:MAG: DUF2339 domain-containing protein [Chloroflexota bacterium]
MLPLLIIGLIGWFVWITSAVVTCQQRLDELRKQVAALMARPDGSSAAEPTAGAADAGAPTDQPLAPAPAAPWPEPPQLQLEFEQIAVPLPVADAMITDTGEAPADDAAPPAPPDAEGAEARIGRVWLGRVGVVLLLIGALIAYRYGVTTDSVRLAIGYGAGLGLLLLGSWGQRRRFTVWAQAVTGGGLGLLYLATAAGSSVFEPPLITGRLGFALMASTTVLGSGLAVWYNAQAVGVLSLIGGFATPFVLSTGGNGDMRLLFAYIAILDAGLLLIAYFRRWALHNYLTFAATWGVFGAWFVGSSTADWAMALVTATVFFVIFALVSVAHCLIRRLRSNAADLVLALLNGVMYFTVGLLLVRALRYDWRDLFPFAVAAVYLALGLATLRLNRGDRLMVFAFFGLAVVLTVVAFPLALDGSWVTVAWALLGALLVWLGFIGELPGIRRSGLAVLGLAALRLVTRDSFPARFGLPLLTPGLRAFTFLAMIAALYLAVLAYTRQRGDRATRDGLAATASLFTLWYLTLEIILSYRDLRPAADVYGSCGMTIAVVWAVYGLALCLADLRFCYAGLRNGARVVLGLALAAMAATIGVYDPPAIIGFAGVGLTAAAIWLGELGIRLRGLDGRRNGGLSLLANALAFAAVGLQTHRATAAFITIAVLAGYALLAMVAAVLLRSASARGLAGILAAIAAVAAGYGAAHPEAAWQLRLAAFVLTVPGTCFSIWLAARAGDRRPQWERAIMVVAGLSAAALTAWWGAAELMRSPSGSLYFIDGPRFNLVLIWLGAYGFALGLAGARLRATATRVLATCIQWIALVFLLVVSALLDTPWATNIAALCVIVSGIYAANWLCRARAAAPWERRSGLRIGLAACVATLGWAAAALDRLFPHGWPGGSDYLTATSVRNHWFLIVAGLYAIAVMAVGLALRSRATRTTGATLLALAIAAVMTVGLGNLAAPLPLRLGAFLACIGGAHGVAWAARRLAGVDTSERRATGALSLAAAGLTVVWLAFQANSGFALAATRDFGISASWGVYGLIVLIAGFALRERATRLLGLLTLALTLGKIGLRDMWQLTVNWRIWITIGLGLVFVVASLLYHRFAPIILQDDHGSLDA